MHGRYDRQLDLNRPPGCGQTSLIGQISLDFKTQHHYSTATTVTIIDATISPHHHGHHHRHHHYHHHHYHHHCHSHYTTSATVIIS